MSDNRTRKHDVRLMFSDNEMTIIQSHMDKLGIKNRSALLRKLALDALVVNIDPAPIKEMARLLRISANNINQVAKRANETGTCYEDDVLALKKEVQKMHKQVSNIRDFTERLMKL